MMNVIVMRAMMRDHPYLFHRVRRVCIEDYSKLNDQRDAAIAIKSMAWVI